MDNGKEEFGVVSRAKSIWSFTRNNTLYVLQYVPKVEDQLFKPSWVITVISFLPFVGNIANFGSGIHAYRRGETWYGHQKMAEGIVGTTMDLTMPGCTSEGLKLAKTGLSAASWGLFSIGSKLVVQDVAQRTVARIGSFQLVQYIMNPHYKTY